MRTILNISFEGKLGLTVALLALAYAALTAIWPSQTWVSWLVLIICLLSLLSLSYYGLGSKVGYSKALILTLAVAAMLSAMCIYRVRTFKPVPLASPPSTANQIAQALLDRTIPPLFAHLQIELIVDSIDPKNPHYHFRVRNIGQFSVALVDVVYSSTSGTFHGELDQMVTRDLAPQQPVAINVFPNSQFPGNIISLQIHYQSSLGGKIYDFTSKSEFDLSLGQSAGEDFDPISTDETVGDTRTIGTRQDVSNLFLGPTGTIDFVASSVNPDMSPNVIFLGNKKRQFVFNPLTHWVVLKATFPNGASKLIAESFIETPSLLHILIFEWSEAKQTLGLAVDDGKLHQTP